VFEDRRDAAEADEDGGGGDEEYEISMMREPERTGTTRNGRDGIAIYEDKEDRPYRKRQGK
jgi:hypothetical protein